jgi:hypothetical protein
MTSTVRPVAGADLRCDLSLPTFASSVIDWGSLMRSSAGLLSEYLMGYLARRCIPMTG